MPVKTATTQITRGLLLAVALAVGVPAVAAAPSYLENPRILAQKKFAEPRLLSKSQAAAIARSRHGGKVLKVESTDVKGNYRVRLLLESGRIKTVAINSPRSKKT